MGPGQKMNVRVPIGFLLRALYAALDHVCFGEVFEAGVEAV